MVDEPKPDTSNQLVSAPNVASPAKRGHSLFVVVFLAIILVASCLVYFVASRNNSIYEGSEDELETTEQLDCSVLGNEVSDVPEGCTGSPDGSSEQKCNTESEEKDCPQEATLGVSTVKAPLVWPVDIKNWPAIKQPIANCDLLYSKDGNENISPGIEMNLPPKTPVIAAASGTVSSITGNMLVIETGLRTSANKILFLAYGYLGDLKVKLNQKVAKGDLLGLSGSGGATAELSNSLFFGIWTIRTPLSDHIKLNTIAGKTVLTNVQHPLNYLPLDGREISGCKNTKPYYLPISNPGAKPVSTVSGAGVTFPLKAKKSEIKNRVIFRGNTTAAATHPYASYDIQAKAGTSVVSMTAGTVLVISADVCGGQMVGIYSSVQDRRYSYMHLNPSTVSVKMGQPVNAGTLLGQVGATKQYSCDTADHLHLDVVKGKVRVSCSVKSCPAKNRALFVRIGPELFSTYQKLIN